MRDEPLSCPSLPVLQRVFQQKDISRGIGYGFIAYTLLKPASGKWREVHPLMYVVSALFALSFVL